VAEGLVHRSSGGLRSRPVRRIKTKQAISSLVTEQRR
jgi:hypothetical protein